MKYGYIRVSSKSQQQNTSLTQHRADVIAAGAEMVVEEVFSGGTVAGQAFDWVQHTRPRQAYKIQN